VNVLIQSDEIYNYSSGNCSKKNIRDCISLLDSNYSHNLYTLSKAAYEFQGNKEPKVLNLVQEGVDPQHPWSQYRITEGSILVSRPSSFIQKFKDVYNFLETTSDIKSKDKIIYAYLRAQYLTFSNFPEYKARELAIVLPRRDGIKIETLNVLMYYLAFSIIVFTANYQKDSEKVYEILFSQPEEMQAFSRELLLCAVKYLKDIETISLVHNQDLRRKD
jgi:hypothetical protein